MKYPICLHDRSRIAEYLRRDPANYVYEIGDLDDFFWPYTTWYGEKEGDAIKRIALVYHGADLPVLLAYGEETGSDDVDPWVEGLIRLLPDKIYAHLSPGLRGAFATRYQVNSHGKHWKMLLTHPEKIQTEETSAAEPLNHKNLDTIQQFYQEAYPGNWFDARMLETGQFFGIFTDNKLVSVAGVHVYSPEYRVAAIGSIATLPYMRGRGLGRRVTAQLCQNLSHSVDVIGLNVLQSNQPAIACYQRLGFEIVAEYEEFMLEAKS